MRATIGAILLAGLWLGATSAPPAETVLVKLGSVWHYLDDGSDPGTTWRGLAFDDSAWRSGSAELGYGDNDEETVVRALNSQSLPIVTTYFRHEFVLKSRVAAQRLRVRLLADDGAVVYLNGTEVARANMPQGAVSAATLATSDRTFPAERELVSLTLDPRLLVKGRNLLAVEVHQSMAGSDDLSFDLELLASDGQAVVTRGPYLQCVGSDRVTVRWRTDWPTSTALWTGPRATVLTRRSLTQQPTTEHEVTLTGLAAETEFFYAVGDATGILGGDATHHFKTSPPKGAVRDSRIWVLGDSGTGTLTAAAVRDGYLAHTKARRADVLLMLGDNAYEWGLDSEYQMGLYDMYPAILRTTPVWPTLGNHDAVITSSATSTGPYYDMFTLPTRGECGGVPSGTEAYYSFDHAHIHFICLNSQDVARTSTGAMATWLRADLAATTARWVIAFFHHPPYSKGSHNSDDPRDSDGRMRDMREVYLPILEAGGVDLVLTGHSHSYERSFLIDGHYDVSTTLKSSMILDRGDGREDGDGAYVKPTQGTGAHEGAVYVVAGCSAKIGWGTFDHPVMHIGMVTLGSVLIDVKDDRLDLAFLDFDAVVRDEFTIRKGERRTLKRVEPRISLSKGGTQTMLLNAGGALGGSFYQLASSFGNTPGFQLGPLHVPLNPDPWFDIVLGLSNSAVFQNTHGLLDSNGEATVKFVFPSVTSTALLGAKLYQAFVVADSAGSWRHASNTVRLTLDK